MIKHHPENERVKYEYLSFLRDVKGRDSSSLDATITAWHRYETFTRFSDFRTFDREQAREFKAHLAACPGSKGRTRLSVATTTATLRVLKMFFIWLSEEPQYRVKIRRSHCDYLNPNANEARIASARRSRAIPTLAEIERVIMAMPHESAVEKRDRAVLALAIISIARHSALVSLKLKHIDFLNRTIFQDAREVRTKTRKTFTSHFMPVGEAIREIVESYVTFLRLECGFGDDDPILPKTMVMPHPVNGFAAVGLAKEHWSSGGPIRGIFKSAFERLGLPYSNPHSFRNTIVLEAYERNFSLEQLKALSQSFGHKNLMTTVSSYGEVPRHREIEIMRSLGEKKPSTPSGDLAALLRSLADKLTAERSE